MTVSGHIPHIYREGGVTSKNLPCLEKRFGEPETHFEKSPPHKNAPKNGNSSQTSYESTSYRHIMGGAWPQTSLDVLRARERSRSILRQRVTNGSTGGRFIKEGRERRTNCMGSNLTFQAEVSHTQNSEDQPIGNTGCVLLLVIAQV